MSSKINEISFNYIMDKINYIDKILWINLDKSTNRKINMENLLKDINIPNIRINAIDAEKYDNFNNIVNTEFERDLNNYQIAVSLSHIKAISSLKDCSGDYFMICEDDISFDNIKYFPDNHDLKHIIVNAPGDFEVLMLYKTCCHDMDELYGDWMNYFNRGIHFYGAACYIISRKGINKMIEMCEYIDDNNFVFNNIKFDFSEFLLYKNLKTYAYKYNYITIIDNDSTIGSELTFHRQSTVFQLELIKNDFEK